MEKVVTSHCWTNWWQDGPDDALDVENEALADRTDDDDYPECFLTGQAKRCNPVWYLFWIKSTII